MVTHVQSALEPILKQIGIVSDDAIALPDGGYVSALLGGVPAFDEGAPLPVGDFWAAAQDDVLMGMSAGDLVFGHAGMDYIVMAADADVVWTGLGDMLRAGEAGWEALLDGADDAGLWGADLLLAALDAEFAATDAALVCEVIALAGPGGPATPASLRVTCETREDGDYTIILGNMAGDPAPAFRISIAGRRTLTAGNAAL